MNGDWVDQLSDSDRRGWERFVRHVREDAVGKIAESAMVMSLVPDDGKADVKFAVELGFAILYDKPIVLVAMNGREIPPGLRRVAHHVIELENDVYVEEGREEMAEKLKKACFLLGIALPEGAS